MIRRSLVLAVLALGALAGVQRPAAAAMLPDSTQLDGWRLSNGLEVRVRHVPHMAGVVITTGYRSGTLDDPAGREGLAEVLSQLAFHSAAGDIPDRSPEEMASLRPLGWKVQTTPRMTLLSEVASAQQFPGVLRQVATRMRGVTVTEAGLGAAVDTVRRSLANRYFGIVDQALEGRLDALARGVADEAIVGAAMAKGLGGLKARDAQAELARRFVPANACLALAGDFSNVNVRALIEHEFGSIPAGSRAPDVSDPVLQAGERQSTWPGLDHPVPAVGILAPSLDDSTHASFFLAGLMTGLQLRAMRGNPAAPVTLRFLFSAYDSPDMLRLYPDLPPGDDKPATLGLVMDYLTEQIGREMVTRDLIERVKAAWDWLLGGPLPPGLQKQAAEAPGMLVPLTSGMATRALWRGDDFWDGYRRRFEASVENPSVYFPWMTDPAHQVRLVLVPKK